jgi:hypothetical protein
MHLYRQPLLVCVLVPLAAPVLAEPSAAVSANLYGKSEVRIPMRGQSS